jgi:hypothetical protein
MRKSDQINQSLQQSIIDRMNDKQFSIGRMVDRRSLAPAGEMCAPTSSFFPASPLPLCLLHQLPLEHGPPYLLSAAGGAC